MNRSEVDRSISALSSRVFLLHNVHQDHDVIFETRWAMSYLRGPLTRPQVRELMTEKKAAMTSQAAPKAPAKPAAGETPAAARPVTGYDDTPPTLPPDLQQVFLPTRMSASRAAAALKQDQGRPLQASESKLVYEPSLLALGRVRFTDRTRRVDEAQEVGLLVQTTALGPIIRWENGEPIAIDLNELQNQPESGAVFGTVPTQLNSAAEIKAAAKDFSDYLCREQVLNLRYVPALGLYAQPGESERDFAARAQQVARENRDAEVQKLRQKYETQVNRLQDRLAREQTELSDDQAQYDARKREELVSAGETVIGMLGIFGRRRSSSTAVSRAATKRRLTSSAQADIQESQAQIARLQKEMDDTRHELELEAEAIGNKWASVADKVETYPIRPARGAVQTELVALAWAPYWEIGFPSASGSLTHARVAAWH
jgi:hypothetical protein